MKIAFGTFSTGRNVSPATILLFVAVGDIWIVLGPRRAIWVGSAEPITGRGSASVASVVRKSGSMRAEVRSIEANDIHDWGNAVVQEVHRQRQWFTVTVGAQGGVGGDLFQVQVASVENVRRFQAERFVGLVVERFDPESVSQAIRAVVQSTEGNSWTEVARSLSSKLRWEYEDMGGPST